MGGMNDFRDQHLIRTPEEISSLISQYRSSGLGLARFARKQGIPAGRLHYWVYQKAPEVSNQPRSKSVKSAMAPMFQEVKLTSGTPVIESWAAEVHLPRGIAVRFSPAATAEWIGSVVQALQRPC
jgi:hypothetical protein